MKHPASRQRLASLPSIDKLLARTDVQALTDKFGRPVVLESIRASVADVRKKLVSGDDGFGCLDLAELIIEKAALGCNEMLSPSLKPVLNLTGTVLHTNLGRAPLPEVCIQRVVSIARGASNLEFDVEAGRRGDRDSHVENWIQMHTGAEAATVVNNNAAAVMLTLNSLARSQGVAVSRGELVEIGGSFRIPDVMSRADCELIEVGTTNRTHARDYLAGIESGAVAVMKVHTSNYAIQGFTNSVDEGEISEIANKHGVISITDLGSGCLVDLSQWGLPRERTVAEVVETGVDVITFSGDKLLGGPQCGIIAGKRDIIAKIKSNPMKRALRCDKLTLAALEAVLELYADPENLTQSVPAISLLTRSQREIRDLAEEVLPLFQHHLADSFEIDIVDCESQIGSGAVPINTLPSVAIRISARPSGSSSITRLALAFRTLAMPVMGRVHEASLWFDLRCLLNPSELAAGLEGLKCP